MKTRTRTLTAFSIAIVVTAVYILVSAVLMEQAKIQQSERQLEKEQAKIQQSERQLESEEQSKIQQLEDDIVHLFRILGYDPALRDRGTEISTIQNDFDQIATAFGTGLPVEDRNYKKIVLHLSLQIAERNRQINDANVFIKQKEEDILRLEDLSIQLAQNAATSSDPETRRLLSVRLANGRLVRGSGNQFYKLLQKLAQDQDESVKVTAQAALREISDGKSTDQSREAESRSVPTKDGL